MSDTREAIAQLVAEHCYDAVEMGRCDCGMEFDDRTAWSVHLVELIDVTHLVVPRSDIERYEYAVETAPGGPLELYSDRAVAANDAERRGLKAFERPVLPWSPIPLPEDGQ